MNDLLSLRKTNTPVSDHSRQRLALLRQASGLADSALPGVELMGCGYHIFGKYASTHSITHALFDWTKLPTKPVPWAHNKKFSMPDLMESFDINTSEYNMVSGESIEKYQSSLASKIEMDGSYNLFSGSLKVDFDDDSTREGAREFTRVQQNISKWNVKLRETNALRGHMYEGIRKKLDDIKKKPAAKHFFDYYGTHFLSGVIMGGSITYSSGTTKALFSSAQKTEVTAKMSYKSLTGQITAKDEAEHQKSMTSFNLASTIKAYSCGGEAHFPDVDSIDKVLFNKWTHSISDHPNFIDFTNKNSLTPIWDLCADKQSRAFLQRYFSEYANARSKELQLRADYIDQLIVISGSSVDKMPPGPIGEYKKINQDLNQGAGGQFIYLCYHLVKWNSGKDGLSELKVIYGHAKPPPGWVRLPQDLNAGAKGELIHLCYKSSAYESGTVIKDIQVNSGDSDHFAGPYGYEKVPGDLNKGHGGKYIYVFYLPPE